MDTDQTERTTTCRAVALGEGDLPRRSLAKA
jgi:hypothetical protein